MRFSFFTLDESSVREIARWRYAPPYDIYNLDDSPESLQYALDPQNHFYAMRDESGAVVGFCSFGKDGQVPGGEYDKSALDIGMGIRPDLIGQGRGTDFAAAVLDFARQEFHPTACRVTIAAFNRRARHVWQKHAFREIQRFIHAESGREFVIFLAESTNQRVSDSESQ